MISIMTTGPRTGAIISGDSVMGERKVLAPDSA